jgi:hypothetical protein
MSSICDDDNGGGGGGNLGFRDKEILSISYFKYSVVGTLRTRGCESK